MTIGIRRASKGYPKIDSVSVMKTLDLQLGSTVETISYSTGWSAANAHPKGGAVYNIITLTNYTLITSNLVADEVRDHTLDNSNIAMAQRNRSIDVGLEYNVVTSNSAAMNATRLQAAWNDSNEGDELIFPSEIISFDSTLIFLGKHRTITQNGGILNFTGSATDTAVQFGDNSVTSTENITVRGLRVQDNSSGATGMDYLVRVWGCHRSKFYDMYLQGKTSGATNGSLIHNDQSWINRYYNLRCNDGYVGLEFGSNSNAVNFFDFLAEDQIKAGIWIPINEVIGRVKFYGGTIESVNDGSGTGILLEHSTSNGLTFDGMYFEANDRHIEYNSSSAGVFNVTDCRFQSPTASDHSIELAGNCTVFGRGNQFTGGSLVRTNNTNAKWFGFNNTTTDASTEVVDVSGHHTLEIITATGDRKIIGTPGKLKILNHSIPQIESGSKTVSASSTETIAFATAFPAAPLVICSHAAGSSRDGPVRATSISTTGATLGNDSSSTTVIYWIAVYNP